MIFTFIRNRLSKFALNSERRLAFFANPNVDPESVAKKVKESKDFSTFEDVLKANARGMIDKSAKAADSLSSFARSVRVLSKSNANDVPTEKIYMSKIAENLGFIKPGELNQLENQPQLEKNQAALKDGLSTLIDKNPEVRAMLQMLCKGPENRNPQTISNLYFTIIEALPDGEAKTLFSQEGKVDALRLLGRLGLLAQFQPPPTRTEAISRPVSREAVNLEQWNCKAREFAALWGQMMAKIDFHFRGVPFTRNTPLDFYPKYNWANANFNGDPIAGSIQGRIHCMEGLLQNSGLIVGSDLYCSNVRHAYDLRVLAGRMYNTFRNGIPSDFIFANGMFVKRGSVSQGRAMPSSAVRSVSVESNAGTVSTYVAPTPSFNNSGVRAPTPKIQTDYDNVYQRHAERNKREAYQAFDRDQFKIYMDACALPGVKNDWVISPTGSFRLYNGTLYRLLDNQYTKFDLATNRWPRVDRNTLPWNNTSIGSASDFSRAEPSGRVAYTSQNIPTNRVEAVPSGRSYSPARNEIQVPSSSFQEALSRVQQDVHNRVDLHPPVTISTLTSSLMLELPSDYGGHAITFNQLKQNDQGKMVTSSPGVDAPDALALAGVEVKRGDGYSITFRFTRPGDFKLSGKDPMNRGFVVNQVVRAREDASKEEAKIIEARKKPDMWIKLKNGVANTDYFYDDKSKVLYAHREGQYFQLDAKSKELQWHPTMNIPIPPVDVKNQKAAVSPDEKKENIPERNLLISMRELQKRMVPEKDLKSVATMTLDQKITFRIAIENEMSFTRHLSNLPADNLEATFFSKLLTGNATTTDVPSFVSKGMKAEIEKFIAEYPKDRVQKLLEIQQKLSTP